MLTKVTTLEKLGGLRLRVRFSDASEGVHDFAAMVQESGSALEPLRNEEYFARVFLEFGAPTWPNGFDIAPEWLPARWKQPANSPEPRRSRFGTEPRLTHRPSWPGLSRLSRLL